MSKVQSLESAVARATLETDEAGREFEVAKARLQAAMEAQQAAIDKLRAALADPDAEE